MRTEFEHDGRTYYLYCTSPIDHWELWKTVPELIRGYLRDDLMNHNLDYILRDLNSLNELYKNANKLAISLKWMDGKLVTGPLFSALPNPDCCDSLPMIAWKQDNNGMVFIVSPMELPSLD